MPGTRPCSPHTLPDPNCIKTAQVAPISGPDGAKMRRDCTMLNSKEDLSSQLPMVGPDLFFLVRCWLLGWAGFGGKFRQLNGRPRREAGALLAFGVSRRPAEAGRGSIGQLPGDFTNRHGRQWCRNGSSVSVQNSRPSRGHRPGQGNETDFRFVAIFASHMRAFSAFSGCHARGRISPIQIGQNRAIGSARRGHLF